MSLHFLQDGLIQALTHLQVGEVLPRFDAAYTYFNISISKKVFMKILFIYFQTEGKGKRKREKHPCVVAFHRRLTGDLAHNPGMCPDWESNHEALVCRPVLNPLSYSSQGFPKRFLNVTSMETAVKVEAVLPSNCS